MNIGIFKYFPIKIFIRTFVRFNFVIQIYSDIRLSQICGYKYIQIFVRIKMSKVLILKSAQIQSQCGKSGKRDEKFKSAKIAARASIGSYFALDHV